MANEVTFLSYNLSIIVNDILVDCDVESKKITRSIINIFMQSTLQFKIKMNQKY